MKRMKGFLKLTAVLLAAMMVLPAFAVLAEETEFTVTVTPNEVDDEKKDILVEVDGDVETVQVDDKNDSNQYQPDIELAEKIYLQEDSYGNQLPLSKDVASITVNVDGDVNADSNGVDALARTQEVHITAGDVQVQGKSAAYGVQAGTYTDGKAVVEVGQVTVSTEESNIAPRTMGIYAFAHEDGSITVSTGDISSTMNWTGESDPMLSMTEGIMLTAHGNSSTRIDTGDIDVVTNGVEGNTFVHRGVEVSAHDSSSVTITTGSVTAKANDNVLSDAVYATVSGDSTLTIAAEGDIITEDLNGNGVQIIVTAFGQDDPKAEIYADGTISGGKADIMLYPSTIDRTGITAWQIGSGEDGPVIISTAEEDVMDSVKDSVNYIVKLGKGFSNSDVTTANGNTVTFDKTADIVVTHGKATDGENYTYHTAVEDEKVSLSFDFGDAYDPDKGDTLKVLYNADDNKSAMKQGSKASGSEYTLAGNVITLLMKRGGGMKLAASVNHAHKYVSEVTEPTCTEGGYTTHTCSRCGDSYTDSETQAAGHTPGAAVKENVVEPQIGKAGSYEAVVRCTKCGAEISRETVTVDPLPEPKNEPEPQPEPEPEPEPQPQPEPEPKPEPEPAPARSAVKVATVRDAANKISITFFSNGTFEAQMEDGTTEKGEFKLENGGLVLACGPTTVTVGEDGAFTYTSQHDPERSYEFRMDNATMDKLKKALQ